MDVGADGDLHGVASIRCRTGSACLPLSSPRWSSRRRRCCSCGRRSGTRSSKRSRETTSARPSWRQAVRFRSGQLWLFGARSARRPRRSSSPPCGSRRATGERPVADRRRDRRGDHAGEHGGRRCRCAPRRASAPRTSGWSRSRGAAGRSTWPRAPRSAACSRPPAAPLLVVRACAASGATGGRRARRRSRASRVVFTYLGPVVLDPVFNKFTPLPAGDTRADVLDLAERAGRRRGRGLLGRRLAPHDRRQRLRDRDRPHQARRALRHAAEGLHARRDAARGRPRARPRALPRRPARPAVARAGRAVRDARRRPRRASG